jgi:hypothetical protein
VVPGDVVQHGIRQPMDRDVLPAGSSRGMARKSDPTNSRPGPIMSMRYRMARRSKVSES